MNENTPATDVATRLRKFFTGARFLTFVASLAVMAVIAIAYFHPDAVEGNVLRQHDMKQGIAIGQEAKAFHEATGETTRWTNSLFCGMPNFQIAPSYPSNSLFQWIGTVMGLGLPSPSNLLAMMMVGFFILLLSMKMRWYVALIGAIGYGFSSYFLIIIGAGHIWKFVTLAYIPPTIAGIVLCYRGRYLLGGALTALFAMMQIASNHVQMSYYFMFVVGGFAIAYLIEAWRGRKLRQWCVATGAIVIAAIMAVGANLPNLYNTYEYSKESMRGGHSELTRASDAAQATSGLDRDYITQYSYAPSETFTLLIPNIKGGASAKPEKGQMTIKSLSDLPGAQQMLSDGSLMEVEAQYLSYMSQYFGDPEGTNGPVYVGAVIFALALLGAIVVRGSLKWVLVALTLLSVALAWGRHMMWFTNLFIDYVPMYSKFRTVESILVIAEFTLPLLAAMALQKVVTTDDAWTRMRKPLLWSFGIAAGLCVAALVVPSLFGSTISENDRLIDSMISQQLLAQGYDQQTVNGFSLQSPRIYAAVTGLRKGLIQADALRSLVLVLLAAGALWLCMRRKLKAAVAFGVIGVLVIGDLYIVNKRYIDHESFVVKQLSTGAPIAMTAADREILQDTDMNYRVMDIPRFASADPSYYHKAVGGYHAAKLTRFQDLIDCHLANFTRGNPEDADFDVLNMLNARYVVDMGGQVIRNEEAFGNAWLVDKVMYVADADNEMSALSHINLAAEAVADRQFAEVLGYSSPRQPGDTIYETSYAPNRLTYHAQSAEGGVAVFSEVYFPWGWKAEIDGCEAPIGRVNYLLRAISLPAGIHEVTMTFDPPSLHATTGVATAAVIVIYLALMAALVLLVVGGRCRCHCRAEG